MATVSFPPGFLIIDKPSGVTSFSMVSLVRRLTGVRRVGHAGTLDPLASGVLPVAVGAATRLIEYLDDASKTYVAGICFGTSTDTYDAEGAVTAERDASSLGIDEVRAAAGAFAGDVMQTPPRFSAIKLAGKPLYRYAREGVEIEAAPRVVRIDRVDVRSFDSGMAEVEVECGKGTYIRSLAHDLGEALGTGAHLASLRRTSSGGFAIADAHSPDAVRLAADDDALTELLLAPDRAVERRPAAIFDDAHSLDIGAGRPVSFAASEAGICRAYAPDGSFLAVLRRADGDLWRPEKVFGSV